MEWRFWSEPPKAVLILWNILVKRSSSWLHLDRTRTLLQEGLIALRDVRVGAGGHHVRGHHAEQLDRVGWKTARVRNVPRMSIRLRTMVLDREES